MGAPYRADAATLVAQNHETTASVRLYLNRTSPAQDVPFTLCAVTFDEHWDTSIQVDMTCPGKIHGADPRGLQRVEIDAGYIWPGIGIDSHRLATLYMREYDYDPITDTSTMRLGSSEAFAVDYILPDTKTFVTSSTGVAGLLALMMREAMPTVAAGSQNDWVQVNGNNTGVASVTAYFGQTLMQAISNVLDDANLRIDVLADGSWDLIPRESQTSFKPDLVALAHNGIVKSCNPFRNRETFRNDIVLRYWWDNGAASDDFRVYARVASGPYSWGAIGRRTYVEEINGGPTVTRANANAKAKLLTLANGGAGTELTAVACYWARPGARIYTNDSEGGQTYYRVHKVQFQLETDTMTLWATEDVEDLEDYDIRTYVPD